MPDNPAAFVPLPLYIDLGATFLFSVTGAMAAIRRHYDWVGLFVLALCSGLGGGLLRDGLFIQDGPPAAMREQGYMWAVFAGCLVAGLFHGHVGKLERLFLLADALGLAAYGVVGASKARSAGLSIPASIVVGVVNAAGGSLIRDVLSRDEPLVFKPGQFYMLAAFVGVCTFILLGPIAGLRMEIAALLSIVVTFTLRILSIVFGWKTGAILPPPDDRKE